MSGLERVGHPEGLEDPIWVDTTKLTNGWNALPFFEMSPFGLVKATSGIL